jgi:hypothetical protein
MTLYQMVTTPMPLNGKRIQSPSLLMAGLQAPILLQILELEAGFITKSFS